MIYTKGKNYIKINDKSQFNITHILECGQVFCYEKIDENHYFVFPANKTAEIIDNGKEIIIKTSDVNYFINWFNLDVDYSSIKTELSKHSIMKSPIEFGYGIRILKQDIFETLISFIISANNNIKRIKLILNNLREALGDKIEGSNFKSFPSYEKLLSCDENFFKSVGSGYRASYLFKVLRQINMEDLSDWQNLKTKDLRSKLIELNGVGPKVADCLLLFGYNRFDVFPVDIWIEKMYNQYYRPLTNREKISQNLVKEFGIYSGYAQQYLFYYQRSFIGNATKIA